ncbi:hypothetical protein KIL84_007262 [Mauremys mutica]|uniref:Secreted protein n=1 Tax=Mauremys mutica TaxID=74926 RepID=A0A9D4AVE5_9SAUR|nr:hypothetical protein KIL84_007262 [Mauremys mutica]
MQSCWFLLSLTPICLNGTPARIICIRAYTATICKAAHMMLRALYLFERNRYCVALTSPVFSCFITPIDISLLKTWPPEKTTDRDTGLICSLTQVHLSWARSSAREFSRVPLPSMERQQFAPAENLAQWISVERLFVYSRACGKKIRPQNSSHLWLCIKLCTVISLVSHFAGTEEAMYIVKYNRRKDFPTQFPGGI